jgi:adenosylcobinamide-GDP ribazoletransferase
MLEIMRDSRIGAHGAAALNLLLIGKVAGVAQAVERHDLLALLAFPTIGRWLAALLVVLFPYARPDGIGLAFNGEAGRLQGGIATAIAAVTIAVLGPALILPSLGAGVVVFAFAFWMHRRLGGLTGDVYGASIELGEVAMLVLASIR